MASEPPTHVTSRFGPNEWLVDEIYEQFLRDKDSVDPAWWEFFEDYSPAEYSPAAATKPATPAAPAPSAPSQEPSTPSASPPPAQAPAPTGKSARDGRPVDERANE